MNLSINQDRRRAREDAALAIQIEGNRIMSLKLKALGLALLAATAVSAVAVVNASATTGGHFVSEKAHTVITGLEGGSHTLEYSFHGMENGVICDEAFYDGTITAETVTDITLSPFYAKCHTTGNPNNVPITPNGCTYTLTFAAGNPATTENTVDLVCPAGKAIEIHHPNCTVTIPPANNLQSVTYTTTLENGRHTITLDANLKFNIQFHGGLCVFLGTNQTGTLTGSLTLKGYDGSGNLLSITTT